jgi:ubiquinone/menaquinone biosynthesis C-methylase UbiE
MVMKEPYSKRNFEEGPPTYTDAKFLDLIFDVTGLLEFNGSAIVVDFMSGPGKVASGMQERAIRHQYTVLDASEGQLAKINTPSINKICDNVTDLHLPEKSVDVGIVRYGLKDIPAEQQIGVLRQMHKVIKDGGRLVIVDMVSPEGMKEWNNHQHSQKQQFNGRIIEKEGECNIPTEEEWLRKIREAGFEPSVADYYKSLVKTTDWVRGSQITNEQRGKMDILIMDAPEDVKKAFNIRREKDEVMIDYPVVIIKAIKKESESNFPTKGTIYE